MNSVRATRDVILSMVEETTEVIERLRSLLFDPAPAS